MRRIQYYDVLSLGYDVVTGPVHQQHRIDAVKLLRLRAGQTVLDVPCGTGTNLPFLSAGVGPNGHIVGCDYSPRMLAKARTKVDEAGWDHVRLIEADARLITRDQLGCNEIDAVICMLGMSVMPDWQDIFERTYDMLKPGGRYVMLDLFLAGKRTTRLADAYFKVVANADSTRRFWEPLKTRVLDFETHESPCFGGVILTVAGTKPPQAAGENS